GSQVMAEPSTMRALLAPFSKPPFDIHCSPTTGSDGAARAAMTASTRTRTGMGRTTPALFKLRLARFQGRCRAGLMCARVDYTLTTGLSGSSREFLRKTVFDL